MTHDGKIPGIVLKLDSEARAIGWIEMSMATLASFLRLIVTLAGHCVTQNLWTPHYLLNLNIIDLETSQEMRPNNGCLLNL